MSNLRKSISIGLLGLIAGGFVAISAQGQQGSPRGPGSFADFDLDGSGTVSEEEFYKVRGERMAEMAAEGRQMRGLCMVVCIGGRVCVLVPARVEAKVRVKAVAME